MCESRHDFSKDQHLYTLESPFIHSATDINQRSGPDSPGLRASMRVARLCAHIYLKGFSTTLHSLIVFCPKGTIAQIEAPLRLLNVTHQNGVFISIYVYLLVILNTQLFKVFLLSKFRYHDFLTVSYTSILEEKREEIFFNEVV